MRNVRTSWGVNAVTVLLLLVTLIASLPNIALAQTATGGATSASSASSTSNVTPKPDYPLNCYVSLWRGFDLSGCFGSLMAWVGSWFLTAGGAILRLAGTLFDTLLYYVLIAFGSTLNTLNVTQGIETGWTLLRDISNMLIIGMFVFIAISIILGLKEYGQKRLIANVLIIAVLINFSLLFTRIIIDFSNFTAFVIYKQMSGGATDPTKFDIAQSFLTPMGISSVWNDSGNITRKIAASPQGGSMQALFFGMIGGLLLVAVAVVLLYGCFLIAARALLFIFLMIIAPWAFASYLIPNFSEVEFGWSGWWKSLINNAIFAPMLMLFLAISLLIIKKAGTSAKLPLGQLISDPKQELQANGWVAILVYILGIGLIYFSLKMSSKFAGSISGFNFAQAIAASPVTQGSRFLLAPIGRQFAGRRAYNQSESLTADAKKSRLNAGLENARAADFTLKADRAARRGDHAGAFQFTQEAKAATNRAHSLEQDAAHLAEKAANKAARAKGTFNLMDTKGAKIATEAAGLSAAAAGQSTKETKGFASQVEEKAKHAREIPEKTNVDPDKIREEAEKQANARYDQQIEDRTIAQERAKLQRDDSQKQLGALDNIQKTLKEQTDQKKQASPELQQARTNLESTQRDKASAQQRHADEATHILQRIETARQNGSDHERRDLEQELRFRQQAHEVELKAQDTRINAARSNVQRIENDIENSVTHDGQTLSQIIARRNEANAALAQKEQDLSRAEKSLNEAVKDKTEMTKQLTRQFTAGTQDSGQSIGGIVGASEAHPKLNKIASYEPTGTATRIMNAVGQNEYVANETRSMMKKKQGATARLQDILKNSGASDDAGGGAAPASGGGAPQH